MRSVEHRVLIALRIKFVAGSSARETGRGLGELAQMDDVSRIFQRLHQPSTHETGLGLEDRVEPFDQLEARGEMFGSFLQPGLADDEMGHGFPATTRTASARRATAASTNSPSTITPPRPSDSAD